MPTIPFAAEAGLDIMRRIGTGELQVAGLQIRDVATKQFRYLLRGFENLPTDATQLGGLPPLEPLRAVMSVAHLANLVGVAQNAMLARTLGRIERKLTQVDRRLLDMSRRLERMDLKLNMLVDASHRAPVNRLRAAQTTATTARRRGLADSLLGAARDAEVAARDLLGMAEQIAYARSGGVPVALLLPSDLAALTDAAAEAMAVTASMQLTLGSRDEAVRLLIHVADAVAAMRRHLAGCVAASDLVGKQPGAVLADDDAILAAGSVLRNTQHWVRSRAVCIKARLIEPGQGEEFEASVPCTGLAFDTLETEPEHVPSTISW